MKKKITKKPEVKTALQDLTTPIPGKTDIPRDQDGQPGKGSPARDQTLPQVVGSRQPDGGGKQK